MGLESIGAIRDCMEELGFEQSSARTFEAKAKIINNLKKTSQGNIKVTFHSNCHSGDGPYLDADYTIKSYGIPYQEFKPKWQKFEFQKDQRILNVSGDGYDFSLEFKI
jgi:hypothetical protein